MKRNNLWIHIGVAVIFVAVAAILGQIGRWQRSLVRHNVSPVATSKPERSPRSIARTKAQSEPEVLVRLRPGVTREEFEAVAAKNNDRIEDSLELVSGLYSVDDMDDADPAEVARQYSNLKDMVMFAEPNFRIELDPAEDNYQPVKKIVSGTNGTLPNDPLLSDQWALKNEGQGGGKVGSDINAEKAWETTHGSEDVVIAVLDTGVDYNHSDLASNMWQRPDSVPQYVDADLGAVNDLDGFNAVDNAADPMDENGHGTHCSGIIGAEGDNGIGISGVNWNVKIMPLKFLGRGGFGTTKDAIEAINYAVDRKQNGVNIRVISASWGSTMYSKALEDAIRAAGEQGILFIAAAGNASTDNDKRPHYPSNYKLPNVISVAALDRNDELASFSNYGPTTVHVAAPGKEIVSTWIRDTFREASGTSMATPYVSGIAALVIASEPNISPEELRDRLLRSTDPLNALKGKVASGGRINAAKALGK